jgi:hypothetical protein
MAGQDRIIRIEVQPAEGEKKKTSWLRRLFGKKEDPVIEVPYKGYVIRPAPIKIARVYGLPPGAEDRSGKWQLRLYISRAGSGKSKEREFNAANAYKSRKEATKHCIEFGKEIIDGKSEVFKVDDL